MEYDILHVGLKHKINNTKDFVLFDEIFGCLKGHAYRAAYIINWICIAESIKHKFEEMSKRDGEVAKNIVGVIQDKENKKQATDRFLLEKAEEYLIIDKEEYLKLDLMCTLRGIYAHPIGNSPTSDEVITAIKVGVEAVLSKPPLFKRGYAQTIVKSLYEDLHYIDNEINNLIEFSNRTFTHLHSDTYLYAFEESLKRLNPIIYDPQDRFWSRGLVFTNTFLSQVIKAVDIGTMWDLRPLIVNYPKASCPIFLTPDIWVNLQDEIKDLVISHSLEPLNEDGKVVPPSKTSIENIYNLIINNSITKDSHIDKFVSTLSRIAYIAKKDYSIPLELYVDEIINDLKSHNWYTQNFAINVIYSMDINKLSELSPEKLVILGRNILQSADGNADKAKEYIVDVAAGTINSPLKIVEGIILEGFVTEEGKIRVKTRFLKEALMSLKTVNDEFAIIIVDQLMNQLRNRKFKYDWFVTDLGGAIRIIQKIIDSNSLSEVQNSKMSELLNEVKLLEKETEDNS